MTDLLQIVFSTGCTPRKLSAGRSLPTSGIELCIHSNKILQIQPLGNISRNTATLPEQNAVDLSLNSNVMPKEGKRNHYGKILCLLGTYTTEKYPGEPMRQGKIGLFLLSGLYIVSPT